MSAALPLLAAPIAVRAVYHIGPAAAWLPVFRRWTPGLAGRGDPGRVALTFDDGPAPTSTPAILAALAESDVRATFFVLGHHLQQHPELGRAAARAGHEIAVHGWRHQYLLGRGYRHVRRELARTADLIAEVSGTPPTWFRPPYGVLTGEAVHAATGLGLRPVLWTTWARDWTGNATPESILAAVEPGLTGGATLLLHDAGPDASSTDRGATVHALPRLIQRIRALDLLPGPLREHGSDPFGREAITSSGWLG